MKKIMLFLIAFAIGTTAYSQVIFNPKAGYNYSYFTGNFEDVSFEGRSGWQVGADFRFGDEFFVMLGAHYFESENRIESLGSVNLPANDVTFNIKGIRVPLALGADLLKGRRIGLRAYTGPNMNVVLDNDEDVVNTSDLIYDDIAFGYSLGVGVDLGIFTVDAVHEWGLSNVFDSDSITSKNSRIFLSAGILF